MSHVLTLLALSLLGAPGNPGPSPDGPWAMTLRDALCVGFDDCEFAHLKSDGGGTDGKGLAISPADPEKADSAFKAEAMDLALAVEAHYWQVAQQNAALVAAEAAVGLAEQALKRENAKIEVGIGNPDAVAEAQKRVDAYRADLTAAVKDMFATERQLRAVLGLPPEGRRIAPISTPLEAELTLDWNACLAAMNAHTPELAGGHEGTAKADGPDAVNREIALTFLPGLARIGPLEVRKSDDSRTAGDRVRLINKKTHELARYFLEVDANFKLFRTATAQESEALKRLEVLRSDYDQGEASVGVYLDAVAGWAKAVSTVADFKARYNISIASVERAKGTLLDHDQILLLAARPSRKSVIRPSDLRDDQTLPASHEVPAPPPSNPPSKTFSFRLTFGSGPHPAELRGSFTVTP